MIKSYALASFTFVAFLGRAEAVSSEAEAFREEYLAQFRSFQASHGSGTETLDPLIEYLSGLKGNWEKTLVKDPEEFPSSQRPLHQSFQFYFSDRNTIEPQTVETLLNPPLPLSLPIAPLENAEVVPDWSRVEWRVAAKTLRVAWFKLLDRIGWNEAIGNDYSLATPSLTGQFLQDLSQPELLKQLTPSDFWLVIDALPIKDLDPEKLAKQLAHKHQGKPYVSPAGREKDYLVILRSVQERQKTLLRAAWEKHPTLLQKEINAFAQSCFASLTEVSKQKNGEQIRLLATDLNRLVTHMGATPVHSVEPQTPDSTENQPREDIVNDVVFDGIFAGIEHRRDGLTDRLEILIVGIKEEESDASRALLSRWAHSLTTVRDDLMKNTSK